MTSVNSGNVKGLLLVSELFDLKLRLCFSALYLKVKNCLLSFLSEEFVQKVSALVFAISYLFIDSVLFFMRCLRGVCWVFPEIYQIIFLTVFLLVAVLSWFSVGSYLPSHRNSPESEQIENTPLAILISTKQFNSMLVLGSSGEHVPHFGAFLSKS